MALGRPFALHDEDIDVTVRQASYRCDRIMLTYFETSHLQR